MDNFCEVVVDALKERLHVTGFQTPDENKPLNEWVQDTWSANRMDGQQSEVHKETLVAGDGYVAIDWDDEKKLPVFTPIEAELVIPHYDPMTGLMDYASKTWTWEQEPGKFMARMNLHYPGELGAPVQRLAQHLLGHALQVVRVALGAQVDDQTAAPDTIQERFADVRRARCCRRLPSGSR